LLQPANRATVVNNLVQLVNTLNLDGIDIDIEGGLLTSIDNAGNYTPFVQALRNGLGNKLLTAATASYVGGMVPTSSLPYFDFVNIMSYDAIGPGWGQSGSEHSPYSMAVSDINIWKARGLSKEKLVLGVPFYGYGFNGFASDYDFKDIVAQFGASAAQTDIVGNRCAGTNDSQ
jgi:chitinase